MYQVDFQYNRCAKRCWSLGNPGKLLQESDVEHSGPQPLKKDEWKAMIAYVTDFVSFLEATQRKEAAIWRSALWQSSLEAAKKIIGKKEKQALERWKQRWWWRKIQTKKAPLKVSRRIVQWLRGVFLYSVYNNILLSITLLPFSPGKNLWWSSVNIFMLSFMQQ